MGSPHLNGRAGLHPGDVLEGAILGQRVRTSEDFELLLPDATRAGRDNRQVVDIGLLGKQEEGEEKTKSHRAARRQ